MQTIGLKGRVAPGRVLVVASMGAFLAFLDATVVNVAFPDIQASFPTSTVGDLSWVLNAYNIVFASFLVICGRLTDLLGRRRLLTLGTVVFTLASVLCAVSPSLAALVAARIAQALGAAMIIPASMAIVMEAFPAQRRSHAVGLWGASAAVAAGLGPPLGGAMVELGGWRLVFLVNLPLGLLSLAVVRRVIVESRSPGRRRLPDVRGALLFAAALGALTTVIVQGNQWGWGGARILGAAALAVVLALAFVASSRRHPQPVFDPALLRVRAFAAANLLTIVTGMGFFSYMLSNILWLQYVWGYSVVRAGLALVPGALIAAVTAALLSERAARLGYRPVIATGALIWSAAYLWYVVAVGPQPDFLGAWLPGQVLSGLGVGATLPLLGSAALAAVPGGRFATASSAISSSRQLGGVLGIAILVVIIGTPTPQTAADTLRVGWLFSAGCFALAALGTIGLGRTAATSAAESDPPRQARVNAPERPDHVAPPEVALGPLRVRMRAQLHQTFEDAGTPRVVLAGDALVRAGEPSSAAFLVRRGRLEVLRADQPTREVGPGALVGLATLIAGRQPHTETVRARRDSEVLELSHAALRGYLLEVPEASVAVATDLAQELVATTSGVRRPRTSPALVAVVGLNEQAPVDAVAVAIADGMAPLTVAVTTACAPHVIDKLEADHDRVVMVAPAAEREWVAQCVRQSDRIVVVARSEDALPEHWSGPQGAELVIVGPTPTPRALDAWAQRLRPWRVTPTTDPAHIGPLVNRLAGRSLGLVLAGGAARAVTQIGVIRELEEAGFSIDRVAGTSMGAVIGATYALGHTGSELEDVCYHAFVRNRPLSDYTVPVRALTKGRRVQGMLQEFLGTDQLIETLPRQFGCVSVDLHARERVTHQSGLLWEAVAASCRLPVISPPLVVGDRLLVDGALLDNLPVDLLQQREEGPIIAVAPDSGADRTPRQLHVPGLQETLLRAMTIGDAGARKAAAHGAYVVAPPTLGVGMLEFHQFDRLVESGRRAARQLLDEVGTDLISQTVGPTHEVVR